ncbi:MAG: hypothetical protein FJY54_07420 [Betaproteobacteria bacterium]|jgi:hypothetical protein|nr:hypothetical protein [Betaproteobacteria bacterium]
MDRPSYGRVKRIHAEFRGDEAVELDILEVSLRMGDVARTRFDADTQLTRLALKALRRAIGDYSVKTGQRYPTCRTLSRFLDGEPAEQEADGARVVSLAK